ncbi:MAG: L-Ala-D/L-Glu epimerase [Deltaproteobacteria bacterium]|nr:L-Ala-D/L-Glu epimerase [Deltaproteobacteria bacterium]
MKISSLRAYQVTQPFDISFQSGQAFRTKSESVILQVGYDNGMFSYGESAPRTYVTGESISSVGGLILNSFAPLLLQREVATLNDVQAILNDLELFCIQKNFKPYHSALGAVDIALLDGLGKLERRPASFYLGPLLYSTAPHSVSVPFLPVEQIRQLYFRLRHFPFTHLKVLVGEDLAWNAARLGLLRSLFGERVDLRIEVNGKWNFQQAMANIEGLKRFGISAVEQPLPAHDIEAQRRFRKECGIPVVADESFCTLPDAEKLVASQACDILNIKLSKCGGLLRSKAIADFAHSMNVPCQLGAHVGETKVLTAAGNHFAATTDLLWVDGGYSFLLFKDRRDKGNDSNDKGLSGLGLGLHPRDEEQETQEWQEIMPSLVTSGPP